MRVTMLTHTHVLCRQRGWKYLAGGFALFFMIGSICLKQQTDHVSVFSLFPAIPAELFGVITALLFQVLYMLLLQTMILSSASNARWMSLLHGMRSLRKEAFAAGIVHLLYYSAGSLLSCLLLVLLKEPMTRELLLVFCGIQLFHFTLTQYSLYAAAHGYISTAATIAIVHALPFLGNAFLFLLLANFSQWFPLLRLYAPLLCLASFAAAGILLLWIKPLLKRKLYRELILYRYCSQAFGYGELMLLRYRKSGGNALHLLFKLFDRETIRYWRVCAAIEVCLLQHFWRFPLGICFVCCGIEEEMMLLMLFGIYLLASLLYFFYKGYQRIEQVQGRKELGKGKKKRKGLSGKRSS